MGRDYKKIKFEPQITFCCWGQIRPYSNNTVYNAMASECLRLGTLMNSFRWSVHYRLQMECTLVNMHQMDYTLVSVLDGVHHMECKLVNMHKI